MTSNQQVKHEEKPAGACCSSSPCVSTPQQHSHPGTLQACSAPCLSSRELPLQNITQGFKKAEPREKLQPRVYKLITEKLLNPRPYTDVMSLGILKSLREGAKGKLPGLPLLLSSLVPVVFCVCTLDNTPPRQALMDQQNEQIPITGTLWKCKSAASHTEISSDNNYT